MKKDILHAKEDALNIVKTNGLGLGVVKQGKNSINVKKLYGIPQALYIISEGLYELIDTSLEPNPDCVACRGNGGVPPGVLITQKMKKPLSMYAINLKDSSEKPFDGYIPQRGDDVIIVDDVLGRGKARGLENMISAIRSEGAKVAECFFVAKTEDIDIGVPYECLINTKEDLF